MMDVLDIAARGLFGGRSMPPAAKAVIVVAASPSEVDPQD
jgi:hypothetical protein